MCVQLNAMANRAAGKGYESEDHYSNIRLLFIGIENIHVMRSSQQKILDGAWRSAGVVSALCRPSRSAALLLLLLQWGRCARRP